MIRRLGFLTILTALINVGLVVRDLILAYKLGNNPELNFFLQCSIVPLFALGLVANNAPILLVPASVGASRDEKIRFLQSSIKLILPLSLILLVASLLAGLAVGAWSFLASSATMILWFYFLVSALASIFRCFHNADESYVTPLVGAFFGSLVVAFGYWEFANLGPIALALINLTGVALELIITGKKFGTLLKSKRVGTVPFFDRKALASVAPLICTGVFIALNTFVDQIFAASISLKGLSILLYAGKFSGVVMSTLGTAIGSVALTEFVKRKKSGQDEETSHMLRSGTVQSFIAGATCSVLIWALAPQLVRIAFQRGEFTAEDSIAVAQVVRFGIWLLPSYFVAYYLKRYLVALGLNGYVSVIYGSNVIVNVLLDWLLSRKLGLPGLALASALVQVWSAVMTIAVIKKIRKNA